ncbi:uncharacterized membrane protein YhaH (DUF805 family) [Pseudomonas sp. JUb42]|uniref:DUF805 domain-containing protein n=1 Tax=Pseudomonas sp. JUb42 TaxID=2940611 RepID=UPI002166D090|nr:DUF805 domain-containing protein [Pseudomonas sp. JUb42]MCS3471821.1 uncharacterized membrane protein YhaH (DUF805 family) [Pseudomonas sp. JUb42]
MADTHYKIVFEGQVRPGVGLETAKLNLAQLFKSETAAVEKLFSGNPMALKRGLTQADAQHYLKALNDAGVEARIEADPAISLSLEEVEAPSASARPIEPTATASPYAPPRAPVGSAVLEYAELKVMSVHGRIGRVRYLAWTLVLTVVAIVAALCCALLASVNLILGGLLGAVVAAAFICVSIQIGVQRAHDLGWSGWLLLLNLVPFVGSVFPILLVVMPGNATANQYGPPPPPNSQAVKVLAWMWVVFLVVVIAAGVAGGLTAFQQELDSSATEYEQNLPSDDDEDSNGNVKDSAAPATFFKGDENSDKK